MDPLTQLLQSENKGRADDTVIKASRGEYMIPEDVVTWLGEGDNESGGQILDEWIAKIRKQIGT
ncbi:MAG: hypothetical protein HRT61_01370 [Ekhidna sp.]|nr:hypothetical protein [Ekhidna sp.]